MERKSVFVAISLLLLASLILQYRTTIPRNGGVALSAAQEATKQQVREAYGKLPLYFIENQGQLDSQVAYYIQGGDKSIYFTGSGVTIALWFFFVLVFDLLLMGALVLSQGSLGSGVFAALLMLNPSDIFRLLNMFSSEQVQTMYGLATVMPDSLTNPLALGSIMLAWIVAPFLFATWRFK